jgi:thiamine pyrophosphokinase
VDRPCAILIANGRCSFSNQQLISLKKAPMIIAVDGGIHECIRNGLQPNIYVGDLDSANEQDVAFFPYIETHIYPKEKDETDLELAINLSLKSYSNLQIFGATGNRIDHTLFNLLLLTRFIGRIEFLSKEERLFLIRNNQRIQTHPEQILSLLPINGAVYGVTTRGLKWELENAKLDNRFSSLSNIALGTEVTIDVKEGHLICCLENF